MAAKYYVWGEGVWREVDVASGRVSGWRRRARFVFVRRGRLLVARRRPVLRALEALAAGQPSAAADGPRLPHRSKSERRKRKYESPAPPAPPACEHQYCCIHNGCLNFGGQAAPPAPPAPPVPSATSAPPTPAPPARCEAATQCARDAGTSTERVTLTVKQKSTPPPAHISSPKVITVQDSSSADEFVTTRARRPVPASSSTDVSALLGKPASPAATKHKKRTPERRRADQSGDETVQRKGTRARAALVVSEQSASSSEEVGLPTWKAHAAVKELVVSDADVAVLRGFVARTRPRALPRFDADDAYKRALFYAINPLVELERCARLESMLAARAFAARLGLVPSPAPSTARETRTPCRVRAGPRSYRKRSGSADADKENKGKHSSPNKVRSQPLNVVKQSAAPRPGVTERKSPRAVTERNYNEKQVAAIKAPQVNGVASNAANAKARAAAPAPCNKKTAVESEDSGVAPSVVQHVISQRASRVNAKVYSNMEDHAIVAWISVGSRASLVGGNRVWRELEEQFQRLTGRARTWHSLRNRYLRYILPGLGALHLPPADVSRLRAAAATGAIKRQNRPRPPPPPRQPASPQLRAFRRPRLLSSDAEADGPPAPKRRSLRTRPLASSSKDDSSKESPRKPSTSKETSSKETAMPPGRKEANPGLESAKASGSKVPRRSPRYSELTRQFAARHRRATSSSVTPASSRSPSPPRAPPSPPLEPPSPPPRTRRLFNPNANV